MNIVILHCHFERGGVTQVVQNHIRSLQNLDDVHQIFLLSGPRITGLSTETRSIVKSLIVDDFDYDPPGLASESALQRGQHLFHQVQQTLTTAGLNPKDTILHWHNHSLGKNASAPAVISKLAEQGWRLLLQIHDFAEDNRPQNYLHLINQVGATSKSDLDRYLYPVASQIHYASLTSFDKNVLSKLGITESQTHCLPNSVTAPTNEKLNQQESLQIVRKEIRLPEDASWCLYPVRGIRRKNVGEFVLLSRWLPPSMHSGLTICPVTAAEKRSYQRWHALARTLAPNAHFDAAHHTGLTFAQSLSASSFVLSTSVAEGFGMAFLEPWLMGKRVVARRLKNVVGDFESSGMNLAQFYQSVLIPGSKSWLQECRSEVAKQKQLAFASLPINFAPTSREHDEPDSDAIDFGQLIPTRQVEVLKRISIDAGFEKHTQERNATLVASLQCQDDAKLVDENAELVANEYTIEKTTERLAVIYQTLLKCTPQPDVSHAAVDGESVIDQMTESEFYPCRVEQLPKQTSWLQPVLLNRKPLRPIPTSTEASLSTLGDIKAVIFDVYGTLVVSGSGDVGSANDSDRGTFLQSSVESVSDLKDIQIPTVADLQHEIRISNEARRSETCPKPEVDIVDIWRTTLAKANPSTDLSTGAVVQLAAEYESRANPTWPMPGASELLAQLHNHQVPMGIVSNAQVFTISLVEDLLGRALEGGGLALDLCIFSNRFRQAKPGPRMFQVLCRALKRQGIQPQQAVYVGNDMLNDVWAASQAGLKTAWFVGDRRSIRPRQDDDRCRNLNPDVTLTNLLQLLECMQIR